MLYNQQEGKNAMHIHSTRTRQHRPVVGLILVSIAVFVTWSRDFGAVGHVLHRLLYAGLGRGGTELLIATLCLCGTVCVLPPGTLGRVLVALGEVVAIGLARLADVIVWAVSRRQVPVQRERTTPAKVLPLRAELLSPMDRRKLDDVRGALKQLGFKPAEFEHIVVKLDVSQPIEALVRTALVQLKKAAS